MDAPGLATRAHYQEELEELEARALGGIDLVLASLARTLEAVDRSDIELAALVIADDDRIDGRYLEVHQTTLTMLATQAPVATDLRVMAALLHTMKSIERMGDQCVNIAKLLPLAGSDPPRDAELIAKVAEMGRHVGALIGSSREAFERRDVALARDLARRDDAIDRLNRECYRRAVEIGDDFELREWATTMLLIARALERMGDYAVDVGEQVAFVVTGLFEEFDDASRPGREAAG